MRNNIEGEFPITEGGTEERFKKTHERERGEFAERGTEQAKAAALERMKKKTEGTEAKEPEEST
jgi:hypothetical protein